MLKLIYIKEKKKYINNTLVFTGSSSNCLNIISGQKFTLGAGPYLSRLQERIISPNITDNEIKNSDDINNGSASSLDTDIPDNEIKNCDGTNNDNICFIDNDNIQLSNKTIILKKKNKIASGAYGSIYLYEHTEKLLVKINNEKKIVIVGGRASSLDIDIPDNEIKNCDGTNNDNMCFIDNDNIQLSNKTIILKKKKSTFIDNNFSIDLYDHTEKLLVKKFCDDKKKENAKEKNNIYDFNKEKIISQKILNLQKNNNNELAVIPSYFNDEHKYIIMHHKDNDLFEFISSQPYHDKDYISIWIKIINTIKRLIMNDVYVFDLKLENIVYQKYFDKNTRTNKIKFYLIDLGGYIILNDDFILNYNEFINTFPFIYEYMTIKKNHDTYNLRIFSLKKNGEIDIDILLENIKLQQLKNILYYNVLYSLLVCIFIFFVYQRNKTSSDTSKNNFIYNTLIDAFHFNTKNNNNIYKLLDTLKKKKS